MYVFCCSYAHNVTAAGKWLAFVSTNVETANPGACARARARVCVCVFVCVRVLVLRHCATCLPHLSSPVCCMHY